MFLPMSKEEIDERGWEELDVIIVTGDVYIDHPLFGASVVGRYLEKHGYRVGIISQPDWRNLDDIKKLGKPNYFFAVTAGNLDSMLAHYTPQKRVRDFDACSPEGIRKRPDRATIVYTNLIKRAFKGVPVALGGIEASLRRFAHYDYWDNEVRRSILLDAKADILMYGMGEKSILAITKALESGENIKDLEISGTVIRCNRKKVEELKEKYDVVELPSYEEVRSNRLKYAEMHRKLMTMDKVTIQKHGNQYVAQFPPTYLTEKEIDEIYELPFERKVHPSYKCHIPAIIPVQFSVVTHRGCFGGCSFCSILHHQGKVIQSRSEKSILNEIKKLLNHEDFGGVIQDVGAPTANMYKMGCKKGIAHKCPKNCLYPEPCENLNLSHKPVIDLLKKIRDLVGDAKVYVRSGIRYDLVMYDKEYGRKYLEDICKYHVSGRLKVAPEHISKNTCQAIQKPDGDLFRKFLEEYRKIAEEVGGIKEVLPYWLIAHPNCRIKDMIKLAEFIHKYKCYSKQVQVFTPTPMTLSTTMYYTGINPLTMEEVYVPYTYREKKIQKAICLYREKENWEKALEGFKEVGYKGIIYEWIMKQKEKEKEKKNKKKLKKKI
jgi:uncharacterized radical SAM protein YgiQ